MNPMMRMLGSLPAVALLVLACSAAPLAAQQDKAEPQQNVEEVAAYLAWYSASTAGETEKAMTAARQYLEKYPQGENAGYVRKWLTGIRWTSFNQAVQKKDMEGMIRVGRAHVDEDASFAYWMAWYLREQELLGPAQAVHAKEAAEFSRRAIEFVEKGGVASGIDPAKWDKDANLAWLHQNLALVAAREEKLEEALGHYETSSKLGPKDTALLARNHLGCGTLHKSLYDQAVARYQALPEAERSGETASPAAQQAIDTANRHADAAIQCWARFLALGTGSADLRSRIEAAIGALWTYRHPDKPEGWKALVGEPKTGA